MHKLFLFTLLICPYTFAGIIHTPEQKCTFIDLRKDSLGKVRNQKKISWCYAFSGADLLNYYLDDPSKISAADMAINYNQTTPAKLVRWFDLNIISRNNENVRQSAHQTGFTKIALKAALKKGVCPEEAFPSETWVKIIKTPQGEIAQEVNLDQAMLDIARLQKTRKTLTLENLPYYFHFKNVDQKQFLKIVNSNSLADLYSNLATQACAGQRLSLDVPEKVKMIFRYPGLLKKISQILEDSNVVAFDYDSRILKDRNSKGVKISELHTSLIVGRRWNQSSNKCEFLVRNSWGEGCMRYDPSYDCENGHIWLSEEALFKSSTSIVYIDAKR